VQKLQSGDDNNKNLQDRFCVRLIDVTEESKLLNPTTLTGLLCGYPLVYAFESECTISTHETHRGNENQASSSNCLSMEPLTLYSIEMKEGKSSEVCLSLKSGTRKNAASVAQICAFSMPSSLLKDLKDKRKPVERTEETKQIPKRQKDVDPGKSATSRGTELEAGSNNEKKIKNALAVHSSPGATPLFPMEKGEQDCLEFLLNFWKSETPSKTRSLSKSLSLSITAVTLPRVGL